MRTAPDTAPPPHDLAAEQSVLGSMMLSAKAAAAIVEALEADSFYPEAHRLIFDAGQALLASGRATDAVTVATELRQRGHLEKVGGHVYLHTLVAAPPLVSNATHYAQIVGELARARRADAAAIHFRQELAGGRPSADAITGLRTKLDALGGEAKAFRLRPKSAFEILSRPPTDVVTRLMEPSIIVAGGITVLAAPTKVGKTNLWMHISWALTEGRTLFGCLEVERPVTVLLLELELAEPVIAERLGALSGQLGWSTEALKRFSVACSRYLPVDVESGERDIMEAIEIMDPRPEFVILDSFNAAVLGDPDKTSDARRAMGALRRIQERTGVAFGLTSEIRKLPSGQPRRWTIDDLKGNNTLAYDCDTLILLKPLSDDRRRLAVHFEGIRHGDVPDSFTLVRDGLDFTTVRDRPVERADATAKEELEEWVTKVVAVVLERGPISKTKLRRAVGGATRKIDDALNEATERGHVQRSEVGYIIPADDPSSPLTLPVESS
jgi:KaiC/GvpD/RAD55 family RecA-like ATPase